MSFNNPQNSKGGFTLLELIMVVGIVAILGTVSVIVLNPAQMFKQTRDTNRITDMKNINQALVYYQAAGGSSFGSHNVIYVSLPDTSSTCANLLLPTPPVGWSYACKPATSYRNTDGTGWIPADFTLTQGTAGNMFTTLPIDPVNTLSGDYYYTYIYGTWTVSATLESAKYLSSLAANDEGCVNTRFEVGNDLTLNCNVQTGGGLSAVKTLTAFSFASPSATGVVTEGTHTVAIAVPYGTNVTALVPTITVGALATVSPLSGVAQDFTGPVTYTVTAENGSTQVYIITVTPAASPAKAITAFNFASPSATGVVTEGSHTVAITVPYGTAVTALVPTITITGSSVSPNTGVAQDFTSPVTYTVTAADTTTQAYVVTVTVSPPPIGTMTTYTGTGASPYDIAFDGTNMWTSNNGGNSVTKITPSGTMTTYTGTGAYPYDIAFDGTNMWTVNGAQSVTQITPSGTMTTYAGTGGNQFPIAFDGTNMWISYQDNTGMVYGVTKITPSGTMTRYTGGQANVYGMAFDGTNIWTTNYYANSVTKITPSGALTLYGGGTYPMGIAFDGTNMWVTNGNSVNKISPTGTATTYTGTGGGPSIAFNNITGDMWTANSGGNSVTRVSPTGVMTTYTGTGASPYGIAFDGTNMWTVNHGATSVTKIVAR